MTTRKERLVLAIDRYENEAVNIEISDINKQFTLQIIYIIVLVICCVMANLNLSWNTVIGTIGLGGLSVKGGYKEAQNSLQKYQKDRRTLMGSVTNLRGKLDLCAQDDAPCLEDLEATIRKLFEEAGK